MLERHTQLFRLASSTNRPLPLRGPPFHLSTFSDLTDDQPPCRSHPPGARGNDQPGIEKLPAAGIQQANASLNRGGYRWIESPTDEGGADNLGRREPISGQSLGHLGFSIILIVSRSTSCVTGRTASDPGKPGTVQRARMSLRTFFRRMAVAVKAPSKSVR